jgi:hypothetical protein
VVFSPDGKTIAVAYSRDLVMDDEVGGPVGVVLWDVDIESWQRIAGRIANGNFTRDEWHQYFPEEPYCQTFPELPCRPEVHSNDGENRR